MAITGTVKRSGSCLGKNHPRDTRLAVNGYFSDSMFTTTTRRIKRDNTT